MTVCEETEELKKHRNQSRGIEWKYKINRTKASKKQKIFYATKKKNIKHVSMKISGYNNPLLS